MEENKARTVHFNVGGQLYQVARSLLELYPSTMLYSAAAERWQTDPNATIFIQGNGERFQYCLDYMLRQRVHLPLTIPKAAVLADLDYYGFPDVDPLHVTGNSVIDEVMDQITEVNEKLRDLARKTEEVKLKKACLLLAIEFYAKVVHTESLTITISQAQRDDMQLQPFFDSFRNENNLKIFNDCLALYGLRYLSFQVSWLRHPNEYYVTLDRLSKGPPSK